MQHATDQRASPVSRAEDNTTEGLPLNEICEDQTIASPDGVHKVVTGLTLGEHVAGHDQRRQPA